MPYKDPAKKAEWQRNRMFERYHNDPEHRRKHLARVRTQKATKAELCEKCGASRPEAHHPDYNQPDWRVWLCRDCHLLLHKDIAAGRYRISRPS